MGGRAPESKDEEPPPPPPSVPLSSTLLLGFVLFLLLLSNGRPIGAGDTRPTERVAASLVQQGNLDLDEYPEVEPPFARRVGEHVVSVYPVLSAVLAAPVFALAGRIFALDETGTALAGKVAASLFSALAAALLFRVIAARRPLGEAGFAAVVFALGTSVWSTSQALWQHPAAVLFLCLTLLLLQKAEADPRWAGWAGLSLGLAAAARHADAALVVVLLAAISLRWPRRIGSLLLGAACPAVFVLLYQWTHFGSPWRHGFSGTLSRFAEPWGRGHLGLLVSPAKGLFVFTPIALVALVGMGRAFVRGERWLVSALGAAGLAHWLLIGRWTEWHGGESWGPRMMTDLLPLLLVFLPEGLDVLPRLGVILAAFSVAVQVIGAFAYDYRWERLYQRPPTADHAELWDVRSSPILFHAQQRVVVLAAPHVVGGKAVIHEHPVVLFGPRGSRIRFPVDGPLVDGSDAAFGDVHLQRGARVTARGLRLRGRWDGVFLRVLEEARSGRLELRIRGRGHGTLYVGEGSFWTEAPRWTAYPVSGEFQLRHPYRFPESGGGDLTVTIGRSTSEAELDELTLGPAR